MHQILLRLQKLQKRCREKDSCAAQHQASQKAKGIRGMQRTVHPFRMAGSDGLGNDHRSPGGKSHKKAEGKIENLAGGTTNARKCFLTRKLADDYRIHRVIQLLKEGTDQDRKEKQKNLFPDDSCQHRVF